MTCGLVCNAGGTLRLMTVAFALKIISHILRRMNGAAKGGTQTYLSLPTTVADCLSPVLSHASPFLLHILPVTRLYGAANVIPMMGLKINHASLV
jgi:hypothetical protein